MSISSYYINSKKNRGADIFAPFSRTDLEVRTPTSQTAPGAPARPRYISEEFWLQKPHREEKEALVLGLNFAVSSIQIPTLISLWLQGTQLANSTLREQIQGELHAS